MILPYGHRIRNSRPAGLRPNTLALVHGGSPKYWIITSERGRNTFLLTDFEIIINVLVSSFCFIWIPLLRVCNHYKYFTLSVRDVNVRFWRQIDSRTEIVSNNGPSGRMCDVIYWNSYSPERVHIFSVHLSLIADDNISGITFYENSHNR